MVRLGREMEKELLQHNNASSNPDFEATCKYGGFKLLKWELLYPNGPSESPAATRVLSSRKNPNPRTRTSLNVDACDADQLLWCVVVHF